MLFAAGLNRTCPTFLQVIRILSNVRCYRHIPRMPCQFADGRNIDGFFRVLIEGEPLRNLPYKYLSVVRSGSDNAIVERVPSPKMRVYSNLPLYQLLTNPYREPVPCGLETMEFVLADDPFHSKE